jgi:hypothetical protein
MRLVTECFSGFSGNQTTIWMNTAKESSILWQMTQIQAPQNRCESSFCLWQHNAHCKQEKNPKGQAIMCNVTLRRVRVTSCSGITIMHFVSVTVDYIRTLTVAQQCSYGKLYRLQQKTVRRCSCTVPGAALKRKNVPVLTAACKGTVWLNRS